MRLGGVVRYSNLFCRSEWTGDEAALTILHEGQAFTAQLDKALLAEIEQKMAGKLNNIPELAKQTFLKQSPDFSVSLESGHLVWRKEGGVARLRLAQLPLHPTNLAAAQAEMLDQVLDEGRRRGEEVEQLRQRAEKAEHLLKEAQGLLVDYEKKISDAENLLIERFLPILNSKKMRIRELEHQLSNSKRSRISPAGSFEEGTDNEEVEGEEWDRRTDSEEGEDNPPMRTAAKHSEDLDDTQNLFPADI